MVRLAPHWRNFCVYSGKTLPDAAMDYEHVFPKSLGGNRTTVIRASRELNSRLAKIDARVGRDGMIQFGRRDADARGHSRKKPVPRVTGARIWKPGDPWGKGETRYNLDFDRNGPPLVYDTKAGKHIAYPENGGFDVPQWNIDHVARLQFTVKTFLGMGWKLFGTDFLNAVDVDPLRQVLTRDFHTTESREADYSDRPADGKLLFMNPFLVRPDQRELYAKFEHVMVRKDQTTMLIRELDGVLEWSIACVGYLVGSIRVRAQGKRALLPDVGQGRACLLTVAPDRLQREVVGPIA